MSFPVINEKLAELRRGARYDSSEPDLILAASQIERVAQRLKAKFGTSDVQTVCPDELKDRWYALLRAGEKFELNQRELRMLSWYAEVGTSSEFTEHLDEHFARIPKGVLRGVLASYATVWHKANQDEMLNRKLRAWISKEENSAKLSWWAENPQYWFQSDAPEQIALRIRKELMTAEIAAREFRAPAASMLIQSALSKAAIEMSELADVLDTEELGYLFNGLIREPLIDTASLHVTVHNLVTARSASRSDAFRQKLVNALLTHPSLGDPRLQVANWDYPALATARTLILSWLSVEDIRTFFEIILTPGSDKHGRKDFWLRYERKIRMSRVFISTADSRRRRDQLEDLATRGRRFGSINDSTSVFVLDLGRVVAVEFSQVGNATYLYTKEKFNKVMPDMFVSQTNLSTVKNSDLSIQPSTVTRHGSRETTRRSGGFRHIEGWQSTVDRELEKYGIKADD